MPEIFTRNAWDVQTHLCSAFTKVMESVTMRGQLVTEIYFDMNYNSPALTNGADVSLVNYCPFCGANLRETE